MPRATDDGMKICPKCRENKSVDQFNKDKHTGDGLQSRCCACRRGPNRACYHANAKTIRKRQNAYYAANRDAINKRRKILRAVRISAGVNERLADQ